MEVHRNESVTEDVSMTPATALMHLSSQALRVPGLHRTMFRRLANVARGVPSICYSLRGLVYYQIDLRGTRSDLHSGVFGGAVANPAMVLAQILSQMK